MMNLLPPVGWGEVATRSDLAAMSAGLRSEIAVVRAELRGEIAGLRGDMHRDIGRLMRAMLFIVVASNATLVGLVVAVVQLA